MRQIRGCSELGFLHFLDLGTAVQKWDFDRVIAEDALACSLALRIRRRIGDLTIGVNLPLGGFDQFLVGFVG